MAPDQPSPRTTKHAVPHVANRAAGVSALVLAASSFYLQTTNHSWNLLIGASVVVVAVLGVLGLRTGVAMDGEGFTSRDVLQTTRLRWDEVTGFDKHRFTVRAQLTNGKWKPLQTYGLIERSGARLVEQLRSAHAAATTTPPSQ